MQNDNSKLKNENPDIRFLYDLKDALYDKKWLKKARDVELYYMYRGIRKENGLRYDITIIPPGMLGEEFVKTKGHEHIKTYKEVYIVLGGEAIFLMQKRKSGKIEDVFAVKAKKGNSVVIPSYYGHIAINPAKKLLKMANWISEKCKSDYSFFEKMRGACYYYTKSGWIKNREYKKVPKLRFEKPLKKLPKDLSFLNKD